MPVPRTGSEAVNASDGARSVPDPSGTGPSETGLSETGPFDTGPWAGLRPIAPAEGGHRSEVWRARLDGRWVSIRRSERSAASLDWELDLLTMLATNGFTIPAVIPTDDGRRHVDGVVVQEWLEGQEPSGEGDWRLVAAELDRLHRLTVDHPQRPGCCRVGELGAIRRSVDADLDAIPDVVVERVLAVFAEVAEVPVAVVHGDPSPGNIRIDGQGRVGLLDWDESRVDVVWHDLSNLGTVVLEPEQQAAAERLSNAWEAINAWVVEPGYGRRRLEALDQS